MHLWNRNYSFYSDPHFFNEIWLQTIPPYDVAVNWRLKASNLRKIYRRLCEYYTNQLEGEITPQWAIDVSRIAEHNDSELLCRFLQLVLGAAVLGPTSEKFIRSLVSQSKSVQLTSLSVAQEVKELLRKTQETEVAVVSNPEVADAKEQVADLKNKVNVLEQECTHLNKKLEEACSEKDALSSDNESLRLRVDELTGLSFEIESLREQNRSLISNRTSTNDALYKAEGERNHLKEANMQLLDENAKLRDNIKNLIPLEEECKRLKDDLEEQRLLGKKCSSLESQLSDYKKKMKEWKAQKVEMKVLEDKVSSYMNSIIALEDEQRKNGVLKTQIESLKLENTELKTKLNDEIRRTDKTEFECKQLTDRISELEGDQKRLQRKWRELNEKLVLENEDSCAPSILDEAYSQNSSMPFSGKITQMHAENDLLCDNLKADNEKLALEENINSMSLQNKLLETELKLAQTRGSELEKRLKEMTDIIENGNFANSDLLTKQQTTNEKMTIQIAQLEAKIEDASHDLEQQIIDKNAIIDELVATKELVNKEREKLTRYMEKARRMIEDLEEQNKAVESGSLSRHEFDSIRRERDAYKQNIEIMKENYEHSRMMLEEEQRLFTTHAHYVVCFMRQLYFAYCFLIC
ncbi:unnamed protein product [Thelazia callipaeda]|uniref:HOOK_N domain-containing protein n=1 Tax=Thelazia callipaeda TaxID=103827 RepID=A0A0N5D1M9_THECL|nr:unnamed protein product [Thelazia callipaeda]